MAKSIRTLSGAAKDAYLVRTLAAEDGIDREARTRLAARLQDEIALVALRQSASHLAKAKTPARSRPAVPAATTAAPDPAPPVEEDALAALPLAPEVPSPSFDPYSPNVIVVIRTRGREAVLAELHSIDDVECLRLLAREQQLGIAGDLADAADIRHAIVAAAERRIANRRAAAS
jgi:hypothetical protein